MAPSDSISRLSGVLLLSCLFSWGLFGILLVQLYSYFTIHSETHIRLQKYTAWIALIVILLQTVLLTSTAWVYLVIGWGKPTDSLDIPLTSVLLPLLSATVATFWRNHFVRQMRVSGGIIISNFSSALIVAVSVLELGASFAVGMQYPRVPHPTSDFFNLRTIRITYLICVPLAFACDAFVALNMAVLRRKAWTSPRINTIQTIVPYCFETGLFMALASFVQLLLLLVVFRNGFLSTITRSITGCLYANNLLILFNRWRGSDTSVEADDARHSNDVPAFLGNMSTGTRASQVIELPPRNPEQRC